MDIYIGDTMVLKRVVEERDSGHCGLTGIPLRYSGGYYDISSRSTTKPSLQNVSFVLEPTDEKLFIQGDGLSQAYGVFGSPGTGKTTFLRSILCQLMDTRKLAHPPGGIIIDPKQDYSDIGEYIDQDSASRIRTISVERSGTQGTLNIIAAPISARNRGRLLASTLYLTCNPKEGYWINELTSVIPAVLESLEILADRYATLQEVVNILTGYYAETKKKSKEGQRPGEKEGLTAKKKIREGEKKKFRPCIMRFVEEVTDAAKKSGKNRNGRTIPNADKETLKEHLNTLLAYSQKPKRDVMESIVRQGLGEFTFNQYSHLSASVQFHETTVYEEMLRGTRILLVQPGIVGGRIGYVLMGITRLLFQQCVLAKNKLVSQKVLTDKNIPVFLFTDEFHTVGFEKNELGIGDNVFISQARAFNCLTVLATQNLPQLKLVPGLENGGDEALLSNMACKVFLRCGDEATEDYAISLGGKVEILETSVSATTNPGASTSSLTKSTRRITEELIPRGILSTKLARGQGVLIGDREGGDHPEVRYFKFYPIEKKGGQYAKSR